MNPLRRAYRVLRSAYLAFEADDGIPMAGYIAFSGLLAIFPFLIFAVSLTAALLGPEQGSEAIDILFQYAPPHVAQTLEPALMDVLSGRGDGLLTFSILLTIWLASNAFEAFRITFDRAYDVEETRGYILRRIIAIGFVFVGAIVAGILGVSVVLAPLLLQAASAWFGILIPGSTAALSFILGLLVFTLFLLLMHRYLPGRGMKGKRIWPGVLITVCLWVSGALAFSKYLSMTPSYTITYGALAGVIVTLVFFYLSGVAIIFGAEVNAVLNAADERR